MSVDIRHLMDCAAIDSITNEETMQLCGHIDTQAAEIERLQRIIDSRPAINAGLVEAYVKWTGSIYALDVMNATETKQ